MVWQDEADGAAAMRRLGVQYVLVVFGGLVGYKPDDIDKVPSQHVYRHMCSMDMRMDTSAEMWTYV